MNTLQFILVVSTILWLLIDWLKPIWEKVSFSRYVSMAIAFIGAVALVMTFKLDLFVALNIAEETTLIGEIFAALSITAGSGLINEILKAVGIKFEMAEVNSR